MKKPVAWLFSAATLFGSIAPDVAHAYPATWEFTGTVNAVSGTSWPSDFTVGAPLRVLVSFDTEEEFSRQPSSPDPVTGAARTGARYRSFGTQSLQIAIYLGTTCAPCVPTNDQAATPNNIVLVRDNWQNESLNGGPGEYDGYTFSTRVDDVNIALIMRDLRASVSPEIVEYLGTAPYKPLPVLPDPRLTSMALSSFQICAVGLPECVDARLSAVKVPTYGTYYFLSGRHCQYPDINPGSQFYGDDCVVGGGSQSLSQSVGGSAGWSDFSTTVTPMWPNPTTGVLDALGTIYGEVAFGGPGGLPVLRASSFPSDVSRTNSNVLAYQQYSFGGTTPTPLSLVTDLGYAIHSNWTNKLYPDGSPSAVAGMEIQEGVRAGGASIGATLSVVDASNVPPEAMAAVRTFNSLTCGGEGDQILPNGAPWPAGSILGMATFRSPESQQGTQSATLQILACNPDGSLASQPVTVTPGQKFYLAASLQTPARGRWSQPGYTTPSANGYLDAANTLRVIPDPTAPSEVQQQLAQGIQPTCNDCNFAPELVIDVKPDSADNSINVASNGVIPVVLLGSVRFDVHDVIRASLLLGTLSVRTHKDGTSMCTIEDVNRDGRADLLCHFQNVPTNWQAGQTLVTLAGKLNNGEAIFASDKILLVP